VARAAIYAPLFS